LVLVRIRTCVSCVFARYPSLPNSILRKPQPSERPDSQLTEPFSIRAN
jgi:hypothetical protein